MYASHEDAQVDQDNGPGNCEDVTPFTTLEANKQLSKIAKRKASDDSGLVVDMLQEGSDTLLDIIVSVFKEILKPNPKPPEMSKASRVRVLLKKCDPKLPDNCRPI